MSRGVAVVVIIVVVVVGVSVVSFTRRNDRFVPSGGRVKVTSREVRAHVAQELVVLRVGGIRGSIGRGVLCDEGQYPLLPA